MVRYETWIVAGFLLVLVVVLMMGCDPPAQPVDVPPGGDWPEMRGR